MKSPLIPALFAACLTLGMPGTALASGSGHHHGKPAETHRQECPPRHASAPHSRASDVPFRNDGATRHGRHGCDTGHRHSFLHRHFHRRRH